MRAVVCQRLGDLAHVDVEELPDPAPGPGQVVVRVEAAGANYVDGLMALGRYQFRPEVPYVVGGEVAGVVEAAGPGAEDLVGIPVLSLTGFNGFAEKVLAPAGSVVALPDGLEAAVAATFTQAYCTAHFALEVRGGLASGQQVLVLGAGGGVGLAAVDVARAKGARVVAAGSSEPKRQAALDAGASATVAPEAATLKEQVRQITDGGVDVVLDPVGGEVAEPSLRALRDFGRYLVVGFTSGTIPKLPLNQVLLRNRSIVGVDWGAWAAAHPTAQRHLLEQLLSEAAQGVLRPPRPALEPLERAPEVLQAFVERRAVGRVALVP